MLKYRDALFGIFITNRETIMKLKIMSIIFFLIFFIMTGFTQTKIDAGISIGSEGLRGFYLSIGNYYHVPEKEVVVVRDRKIPDEELPVVFFIAGRAGVAPKVIVNLRLGGSSWYDISIRYGIYPDAYYIPLKVRPGPPYGKAYGYYKNRPKKEWKKIKLSDNDIINLVNLKFISEHNKYSPEKIIKMRSKGEHYAEINTNVKAEKRGEKNHKNGKNKHKGGKKR